MESSLLIPAPAGSATDVTASTRTAKPIVAAYFPEWGIYGRDVQIADVPADQLTHLIYAFTRIGPDGRMQLFDSYAATEKRFTDSGDAVGGRADSWYYPPEDARANQSVWGNFNQIAELKQLHPHLRTSIAIGGWTLSGNFSTTLDSEVEREVFTDSVVDFLTTYTMFDGVDFDWEYPGGGGLDSNSVSSTDGANYVATLQLLRKKLDALGDDMGRRYEISVASAAGVDKIPNFHLSEMKDAVDFFNLMAYDFHGTWEASTGHQAPLVGDAIGYDIATAVERYLQAGVDPSQIILGAPAYTRAWSGVQSTPDDYGVEDFGYGDSAAGAASGTFEGGVYDYKDLLAQLRAGGWELIWDDNAQAAYLWNPAEQIFSSFETPATIALKSAWAHEKGLGGMMFWDVSNDAIGDSESLIKAASDFWLNGRSFAEIAALSGLSFDAVVGGDGQFDLVDVLQNPADGGTLLDSEPLPIPAPLPAPAPAPDAAPVPAPEPVVAPTSESTSSPITTGGGITVQMQLSNQWNGAFEGQLILTNQTDQPLTTWSVTFSSRYELRGVSDFSLQQEQEADGTWFITISPPSWGSPLPVGTTLQSYVQGIIPNGSQLDSLDPTLVLVTPGSTTSADPAPQLSAPAPVPGAEPADPVIGGDSSVVPSTTWDVVVAPGDTRLVASDELAEQFRLGYAWGRQLKIDGFDPTHDRLDLRGFWAEGQQAQVVGTSDGIRVELPFNQQAVLLSGLSLQQWSSEALTLWAG